MRITIKVEIAPDDLAAFSDDLELRRAIEAESILVSPKKVNEEVKRLFDRIAETL